MLIPDLIAYRSAEHEGFNFHCATEVSCSDCPFFKQCTTPAETHEKIRAIQKMSEFALTFAELQAQYPEYFI